MGENIKDFQIKIVTSADLAAAKATTQSFQEICDAGKKSGEEQLKSLKDLEPVEDKAFASKKQMKDAVRGLGMEFPILGRVAHLALNPITAAVAMATAAWAIWKYRVQEMTTVLSGFKLPDLSETKAGLVKAMAQAYSDFSEALRKTATAYNSVDAGAKREDERQDKQAERNKKLLESQKNLALSRLEADKSKMTPGQYEQAKGRIEEFYESVGIKDTEAQKQEKLRRKAQTADALAADAKAKMGQAAKIKVGTEEQDSQMEGDLEKQADEARGGKTSAKARIKEIQDFRDGIMDWQEKAVFAAKYGARYGGMTGSQAIDLEQGTIRNADSVIGKYDAWMKEKPNRKLARNRRGELISSAGQEAGEAATMNADLFSAGGELDQFDADNANQRAVSSNNSLARANKAAGGVNDAAKAVTDEITRSIESGSKVLATISGKRAELLAAQKVIDEKVRSLEATRKLNPPGT